MVKYIFLRSRQDQNCKAVLHGCQYEEKWPTVMARQDWMGKFATRFFSRIWVYVETLIFVLDHIADLSILRSAWGLVYLFDTGMVGNY